jgi:hypothetical protein
MEIRDGIRVFHFSHLRMLREVVNKNVRLAQRFNPSEEADIVYSWWIFFNTMLENLIGQH